MSKHLYGLISQEATKTEKVDNLLAQLEEQRKAMMHVGASCENHHHGFVFFVAWKIARLRVFAVLCQVLLKYECSDILHMYFLFM